MKVIYIYIIFIHYLQYHFSGSNKDHLELDEDERCRKTKNIEAFLNIL